MRTYKLVFILLIAVLAANTAAYAQVSGLTPSGQAVSARMLLSVDKLRPGDTFQLAVQAKVKDDYHIGAHDKDALYQANLTLTAPKGITLRVPSYPEPQRKAFPFAPGKKLPVYEGTFVITVNGVVAKNAKLGPVTISAKLDTQACKGEQCFPPQITDLKLKTDIVRSGTAVKSINKDVFKASAAAAAGGDAQRMFKKLANASLPARLLLIFFSGLLLAFTPCVYPMIPVTVGYFTSQHETNTRKVALLAGAYVFGLALTYALLGALAATTGDVLGSAMQQPLVLVGIAAVLVALALSMFGLYHIQPPAFIHNHASGREGVVGALIMGMIFGVVCAPCVGPFVLGLALYVAHLGSPVTGFLLFFVLSLGLGAPLFLLAAFSAELPAPGMWMVAVKKLGGFLLIGAAAHFIKPLVPDPIAGYMIPAVVLVSGVYMILWEKSIRCAQRACMVGRATGMVALIVAVALAMPKAHPRSLKWQPYTPAAVANASKLREPVMIDFTAKWCGVCQELEHGPFSDPKVIKAAARFQHFRVDGTDRSDPKALAATRRYSVSGFPAVIFVDSSGKEVASARIVGFVNAQDMLKRIGSVK